MPLNIQPSSSPPCISQASCSQMLSQPLKDCSAHQLARPKKPKVFGFIIPLRARVRHAFCPKGAHSFPLVFSTARDTSLFIDRLRHLSRVVGDPFTAWVESMETEFCLSAKPHRWLARELGISRTIALSPKAHSRTTLAPEKFRSDFSQIGIVSDTRFDPDTGTGYVDFLDIDSAAAAIVSLVGYSKTVDMRFHPNTKHEMAMVQNMV
ncbi:hypothetical protein VNI00_010343 [Paramarasmius palmivorus]|uniref:Uncharacterized protein n=1 Tax=Paramarasmius palmivorus TaxID=297713 RepID=A0AAW0CM90_9AGAR